LDGAFGDEESFGVYREDKMHPATGFPFFRHLERLLDGRGGDLLPLRESALTNLSGYPDHVVLLSSCEVLEPDMLTLGVPLSREVGEGLPKVREFRWDLSLGPYRGMGADVVERCANQFKQRRGIPTRYEKRAANYRAMVVIAALIV
jgi:hypothetical protein